MYTLNTLIMLIFCHLIGDYVLQNDFLAKTKGENRYHLFIHCALYCVPFYILFGLCWQLVFIFAVHFIVDPLKARYNKINYVQDQVVMCVTHSDKPRGVVIKQYYPTLCPQQTMIQCDDGRQFHAPTSEYIKI